MCLGTVITTGCVDDTVFFMLFSSCQNNTNKNNPLIADCPLKRKMKDYSVEQFKVSGEKHTCANYVFIIYLNYYLIFIQNLIRHNLDQPSLGGPCFLLEVGLGGLQRRIPTSASL